MTADRKAATEAAKDHAQFGAGELQNLAAAFLEVTAALEQKRKAREEMEAYGRATRQSLHASIERLAQIERVGNEILSLHVIHDGRCWLSKALLDKLKIVLRPNAADQPAINGPFATTGELAKEFGATNDEATQIQTRVDYLVNGGLAAVPNAAAGQDNKADSPKGDLKALSSESLPNTSGPAPSAAPYLHDKESALREVEAEKMIPEDKK